MDKNNPFGYFMLSKNYEFFCRTFPEKAVENDLEISNYSKPGTLLLKFLNYYDEIITTLKENKGKGDYSPIQCMANIGNDIARHDKELGRIFHYELKSYYKKIFNACDDLQDELSVIISLMHTDIPHSYYEYLKNKEDEVTKRFMQVAEPQKLLSRYIENLIQDLLNLKACFDLYFGTNNNKEFMKQDLSVFQGLLDIKLDLPSQEINQAIVKGNEIVLANSLFLPINKKFKKVNNLELFSKYYEELKNKLKDFNKEDSFMLYKYEITSIRDILNVYFNYFLSNNITINKCKNCGKYFIPANRTDEKYCDNPSPEKPNKTCKEYGVKKMYSESVASDPIKNEHYRTSQFYRVRISRAQKKGNTKFADKMTTLLLKYQTNYERMLAKYNKKKLSESDFVTWIIDQKKD